jgi:hypothetical protein
VRGFPSPPVLAGTLSGFIVGVVVTLIATGVISHTSASGKPPPTLAPPASVPDPQLYQRAKNIAIKQLGPSASANKQPRFVSLKVLPAPPPTGPTPPEGTRRYSSLELIFRLYDHPLGRSWRLRAAKADIFAVMKALYTSSLPIYDVRMVGRFPLPSGKKVTEQQALVALLDHRTADSIPWRRWTRKQEGQLWSVLSYKRVDPRFA